MTSLRLAIPVGLLILLGSTVNGQETTIVVPNSLAEQEGNTGSIPGFTRPNGWRLQYVYEASQFASLTEGQRLLTEYRWRPDGSLVGTDSSTYPLRMSLSTTQKSSTNLSRTFAENVGPDVTVVFDGQIEYSTSNVGPPGGPKAFDYVVGFDDTFHYDPSQGNLLVDLLVSGSATDFSLDQHQGLSGVIGFVGNPSDPNALLATASGTDFFSVTQFVFIPEPSSAVLLILGSAVLLRRKHRLSSSTVRGF